MRPLMKIFMPVFFAALFLINADLASAAKKTYTVKPGDTIYKISKIFKISPKMLKEANHLGSDRLKPGKRLVIPAKGAAAAVHAAMRPATPAHDSSSAEPAGQKEAQYHIVKKGDTLRSISKEHAMPVRELMEINDISKPRKLKIGQKIFLQKTSPRSYTVKKGDNIWKIASRFNISAEEIMEINDLESEDLKPGQKLALEDWIEQAYINSYAAAVSETKITEGLKELSESPDLASMSLSERVKLFSEKMLNIPYKFGGSSFMGIDCSAYVQKVFGLLSFSFPRTAREQFNLGEPVAKDALLTGDLVFFRTYASFPSHVGIYLGNNLFIHASSKNKKVTIDSLDTPYFTKRYIGAKRIFNEDDETEDEAAGQS